MTVDQCTGSVELAASKQPGFRRNVLDEAAFGPQISKVNLADGIFQLVSRRLYSPTCDNLATNLPGLVNSWLINGGVSPCSGHSSLLEGTPH